jgi:tetratricopeptide (TPR) repeat protein
MALKPYLDTISGYCDTLSNQELTKIIIGLAKDVSTSDRVKFLKKFESFLPDASTSVTSDTNGVEKILDNIQALKESIEERINSIEDGSYWDDPDDWGNDEYYNDDPDYIRDDQVEDLESLFDDAESLFLDNRLEDACKVYEALFKVISFIDENTYFSLGQETDIREARARYCRCVYETADAKKRLDEFVSAMEISVFSTSNENDYDEDYPLLQDVIEASPDEMEHMASFLPAWKKVLDKSGTKGRPAVLLLEAVNRLEGIKGVSGLARKWRNSQPQGYIFWLNILKQENDSQGIVSVSIEGLKVLKEGNFRERVAEFLIDAAEKLNDPKHLLLGKREQFFSHRSDQNLLDLLDEAKKHQVREKEFDPVIEFFKTRKSINDDEKNLYVKILLMSGKLTNAFSMAKKEKSVGWSYHSNAGVVFGSALLVLAGYSEKADTIKSLLKSYANKESIFSGRISIDEGMGTTFYEEIIKGLRQNKVTKSQETQYLSWVEKIGKSRIDHIVSNKHRRAYKRAAQVLGSLAETYAARGQKSKADKILLTYYSEKYNRFSAFRREVKAVVAASGLLRNSSILT